VDVNTQSPVIVALSNTSVTNISNVKAENNQSSKDAPLSVNGSANVELSDQGKLFQQLDEKSEKVENMLRANMTPEQAAEVEESFQEIDAILEKEQLTVKDERVLDKLSAKIDSAFAHSIEKMSTTEKKEFNKLNSELEGLEQKLESIPEQELMNFQLDRQLPSAGFESFSVSSVNSSVGETEGKQSSNNLSSLTTVQLNKLSALLLKKLSSIQLNKLNATQLNKLEITQLSQLSPSNQAKLSSSQLAKLA
jgi:hypothetical protein